VSGDGISVIIPAYDVDGFIDDALASVVVEEGPIREIIAIDDGSTDGTAARLLAAARREPRLRLLASDRRGPGGARNAGLRAATQPIIAFIDGDDIWPPGKIRRQLQRLAAADRPDVVSGLVQQFRRRAPGYPAPADALGTAAPHVNLGACLFRREVFDRTGLFDEQLAQYRAMATRFVRAITADRKVRVMRQRRQRCEQRAHVCRFHFRSVFAYERLPRAFVASSRRRTSPLQQRLARRETR